MSFLAFLDGQSRHPVHVSGTSGLGRLLRKSQYAFFSGSHGSGAVGLPGRSCIGVGSMAHASICSRCREYVAEARMKLASRWIGGQVPPSLQ